MWHVCIRLKDHSQISSTHIYMHIYTGSSSSTSVTTSVPTSTKRKSLISTREPPLPAFKKPTFNEEWRKKRQGQRESMGRETAAEGVCIYTVTVCLISWLCHVQLIEIKILTMWFKWQANCEGRDQVGFISSSIRVGHCSWVHTQHEHLHVACWL